MLQTKVQHLLMNAPGALGLSDVIPMVF